VQVGVGPCPEVLLGKAGAELDVLADGLAERLVAWQAGLVERLEVQGDEPVTLLDGDLAVPVHLDDVLESHLPAEAVGAAERLGGEPGEVVNVGGGTLGEHPFSTGSTVPYFLEHHAHPDIASVPIDGLPPTPAVN
jgi:hypothetical protein